MHGREGRPWSKRQKQGRCWLRSAAHWPTCWQARRWHFCLPRRGDVRALSFVHHCIAAPVVEELVFRGAIQQLAQPLGRWQAAALQAVLFAVQHGTPAGMAWALGCGLVLGATS